MCDWMSEVRCDWMSDQSSDAARSGWRRSKAASWSLHFSSSSKRRSLTQKKATVMRKVNTTRKLMYLLRWILRIW